MRRIGNLTDESQAKRFCDYLVTVSIEAVADEVTTNRSDDNNNDAPSPNQKNLGGAANDSRGSTWDVWIRDEADVETARAEFQSFQSDPSAAKFQIGNKADEIRFQRVADHQRKMKQRKALVQKMPRTTGGAAGGMTAGMMRGPIKQQNIPVTIGIIVLSALCSFATNFAKPKPSQVPGEYSSQENLYAALSFVDWRDYFMSNNDAFVSIEKGQVWRFITPMFLHGNIMHLMFNMMGVFFLGSIIERLQGSLFLVGLTIVTHIAGMMLNVMLPSADVLPAALQELAGSPFAIGASGALYGLFGYLWIRPSIDPLFPVRLDDRNVMIMLGWLVACIFIFKGIANGAHIGGLISGMIAAAVVVQIEKIRAK